MKLGISIKIDVKKIDKARLFQGQKGTYIDLTTFIDTDQVDQYDNNGFISQSVSKEERDQNIQTQILGNCKVFYNDQQTQSAPQPAPQQAPRQQQHRQPAPQNQPQGVNQAPQQYQGLDEFDSSDIPF
jgi:hypothetical protein